MAAKLLVISRLSDWDGKLELPLNKEEEGPGQDSGADVSHTVPVLSLQQSPGALLCLCQDGALESVFCARAKGTWGGVSCSVDRS